MPPLHHEVVTARVAATRPTRRDAARALEQRSRRSRRAYPATPAGLGVTVGVGLAVLPPLRRRPQWERLPALRHRRAERPALLDAMRFPSDPDDVLLERTTSRSAAAQRQLDATAAHDGGRPVRRFGGSSSARPTQGVRRRRVAAQAGTGRRRPGAELIPEHAELFLGFTSTLAHEPRPGRIANLETLGSSNPRSGYFARGTHMHLSHIFENLEGWYVNFDHDERVHTTFRPGLDVPDGTLTVPQGPDGRADAAERLGAATRSTARSVTAVRSSPRRGSSAADVGPDGTLYAKGTAIPQRADFNTLDNPFFWSAPTASASREPAAGVHFVVFNPSSDDFRRVRLAMDGVPARRDGAAVRAARPRAGLQRGAPDDAVGRTSSCRRGRTARSRSPSSLAGRRVTLSFAHPTPSADTCPTPAVPAPVRSTRRRRTA